MSNECLVSKGGERTGFFCIVGREVMINTFICDAACMIFSVYFNKIRFKNNTEFLLLDL